MTRREWIAVISAAPLPQVLHGAPEAPVAPVSIAKCTTYDEDVTAKMSAMFDQLGGLEKLVHNKTVTIKVNMTGSPGQRFQGMALGLTHYTHPKVVGATAYLLGRAG
ncbi:MAG: hypothetical protein NTW28_22240, partial [Candidatus Solibacter sp.]|nr:hypothetical protein [Candidatus Solibacter sp.]